MKISGIYRKGFPTFIIILVQICLVFPKIVLGSSGESGGGGVTVIPDGSIIIQIVNFLFAIWVLNVLLYKPIRKILTQRKEKVSGLELAIETSNNDVREKDEAFAAGIKEARANGFEQKNALLQEAADGEKNKLEFDGNLLKAPVADLRPRLFDVRALGRVRGLRIPDIVLSAAGCNSEAPDVKSTAVEREEDDRRHQAESKLTFQLYQDLKNDEAMLPSLPDLALRIRKAIDDDVSDARTIALLVESDPAMAAKVLKAANSALYGGLGSIETTSAAVVRLDLPEATS